MAKKIYIGASSVAHKVKQLYIGSGNVAHRIKVGYIGVGGTARKVFPSGYVWNRYNVTNVVTYYEQWLARANYDIVSDSETIGRLGGYRFDSQNGHFIITSNDIVTSNVERIRNLPNNTTFYVGYENDISITSGNVNWIRGTTTGSFVQINIFTKSSDYMLHWEKYGVGRTSNQTPGAYIDQVTSENRNAYPDNGISGSYWYVYQGEA